MSMSLMETDGFRNLLVLGSGLIFSAASLAVVVATVRRYLQSHYPLGLWIALSFALQLVYAVCFEGNSLLLRQDPNLAGRWLHVLNVLFRLGASNSLVFSLFIFGYFTYRAFRPGQTWAVAWLILAGLLMAFSKDLTFVLEGLAGITYFISGSATLFAQPYLDPRTQPLPLMFTKSLCIFIFAILGYLSWAPPEAFKAWLIRRRSA